MENYFNIKYRNKRKLLYFFVGETYNQNNYKLFINLKSLQGIENNKRLIERHTTLKKMFIN